MQDYIEMTTYFTVVWHVSGFTITNLPKVKHRCSRESYFITHYIIDHTVEISSVGIPEISPYMNSEQLGVAGRHLTRHEVRMVSLLAL